MHKGAVGALQQSPVPNICNTILSAIQNTMYLISILLTISVEVRFIRPALANGVTYKTMFEVLKYEMMHTYS